MSMHWHQACAAWQLQCAGNADDHNSGKEHVQKPQLLQQDSTSLSPPGEIRKGADAVLLITFRMCECQGTADQHEQWA
jgi:hypothetical protein